VHSRPTKPRAPNWTRWLRGELTEGGIIHILKTFPAVAEEIKTATHGAYWEVVK